MTRKSIGMSNLIGVVSQERLRNSFSMQGFYARFEGRVAGIHCKDVSVKQISQETGISPTTNRSTNKT